MMSRIELQKLVVGALVRISEDVKGHHDPIRDSANIIANRLGIDWRSNAEFSRGLERVLRECDAEQVFSQDAVSGRVADWIQEQVQP